MKKKTPAVGKGLGDIKPVPVPEMKRIRRRQIAELVVGIVLLAAILVGGGILAWRSGGSKPQVMGAATSSELESL